MKNEQLDGLYKRENSRMVHYILALSTAWSAFLWWLIFG
jgi:hypothetical protein